MKIFKINAKWDYNYINTLTAITLDKEWDRKKEKLLYAFIMFCAESEIKNFLDGEKNR